MERIYAENPYHFFTVIGVKASDAMRISTLRRICQSHCFKALRLDLFFLAEKSIFHVCREELIGILYPQFSQSDS